MLIYDLADPQELQGFVRGVQQELDANTFTLSSVLPNQMLDDIEWRIVSGSLLDQDAAKVRAWDTEAPLGKRQGLSRKSGELPPISKKMRVGEEERLRLRSLQGGGSTKQIVDAIYDDASNLARAVAARMEMFRGEALYTGAIAINENGVKATVSFGRAGSHAPSALTGADKWDAYTTCKPIQNLQTWVQTYVDTNGVRPAVIQTSSAVIGHLLLSDQVRTLLSVVSGAPALVTMSQLSAVLQAFNLPPIVAYDVVTRVDGSATRVIPADKVLLLPPASEPLGKTFWGVTAEALELVGAAQINQDQAAGLTAVVEKTFDPVSTWTKVSAVGLPVLANPNLTLVADVV